MSRVPQELVWWNSREDGYVLGEGQVIEQLCEFRQSTAGAKEAGGILLGFRRGKHMHLVDMTGPMPKDRRRRTYFDRRDSGHQRYALRRWHESAHKIDYLGDWHTHPEENPTPSWLDRIEWWRLLRGRTTSLLFCIVGTRSMWMGAGARSGVHEIHLRRDS